MEKKYHYDLKNINIVFTSVIILGNIFELISAKFSNVYNSSNFTNFFFLEKSYEDIEFNLRDTNELQNIVYIVPDRYLGLNQLRDYYKFDNSDFYNKLRKRNFTIPTQSRSNYPYTYASLLSTLNNSWNK